MTKPHEEKLYKILIICNLLQKLINIYQYSFPKELFQLLVPDHEQNKLQLFKNLILAIIKDPLYIYNLYNNFFEKLLNPPQQYSENVVPIINIINLLKLLWLELIKNIKLENQLTNKQLRKLIFYLNTWVKNLLEMYEINIIQLTDLYCVKYSFFNSMIRFLTDIINNNGHLDLKNNHNYDNTFNFGINIAATNSSVIYKNNLMELISYTPVTNNTYKIPILLIPSCINKYYLFDLSKKKSLVNWLLFQGFTVYLIAWIDPKYNNHLYKHDKFKHNPTFNDYLTNGILQSINIVTNNNLYNKIHLAGYCMGGTMLACITAYMSAIKDPRIATASYFMSLIDFYNFKNLDCSQLNKLENTINNSGYLDGKILGMMFNVLHANELVWPYFINHYLLKNSLINFDTLYWNCDPINLSANMYNFYLRNICFGNNLLDANKIIVNKIGINIKETETPVFFLAGTKDHISNWKICHKGFTLHQASTNKSFILAHGGHISAFLSPPQNANQYYYSNVIDPNEPTNYIKNPGSWWPYWINWLKNCEPNKNLVTACYNNKNYLANNLTLNIGSDNYFDKKL